MDTVEFMREFEAFVESDPESFQNVVYDELAEFCIENDIVDEDMSRDELWEVAGVIIEEGVDETNFKWFDEASFKAFGQGRTQ